MPTVAELKLKYAAQAKVALTPEQHAIAQRKRELEQAEATRLAKARAARYNITLRSIELNNAVANSKAVQADRATKEATMKQFAQSGPGRFAKLDKKAQENVAANHEAVSAALNHHDPAAAVVLIEKAAAAVDATVSVEQAGSATDTAAEEARREAEEAARREEAERLSAEAHRLAEEAERSQAERERQEAEAAAEAAAAAAAAAEAAAAAAAAAAEADAAAAAAAAAEAEAAAAAAAAAAAVVAEEPTVEQAAPTFEMTALADALESGDPNEINKAIVQEFIAAHDPEKLPDVDQMLEDNKGKEGELMKELVEKYDDPAAVAPTSEGEPAAASDPVESVGVPPAGEEGRERAKTRAATQTEFIVSATHTDGEWEVNPEVKEGEGA